ncbi:MAG: methyltransferase [Pseudomonadota bacterium]
MFAAPLRRAGAAPSGDGAGRRSLRERWAGLRNRLLTSRAFQNWAAAFPLTRPIARARSRALFDVMAGFIYTQTLTACLQTGLLRALGAGALSISEVANATGLEKSVAERLLRAAAGLQLTERFEGRGEDRYGLGVLGAAFAANPSLEAMARHHRALYEDLRDPAALLKGEVPAPRLASYWSYAANPDAAEAQPDEIADYTALMADTQAMIAEEVLAAYPLARHQSLLDIGGGAGAFAAAAAARAPHLRVSTFDLPAVAAKAAERFAAAGLADRAEAFGGDFFRDSLPGGRDLVTFVRILHDHDDGPALALLRQARAAMEEGACLLIAEPMSDTPGAEPSGDTYFGFYLRAMGSGRTRRPSELRQMLHTAGFSDVRLRPTRLPLLTRVLTARAAAR